MPIKWETIRNFTLMVGLVTVAIATMFMIVGVFFDKPTLIEPALWIDSFGIAITSLGIASHSVILANQSNDKMTVIANEDFLKIVDEFETKRIQLLQHPDWLGIEGTIWKCKTYLDRAIKLKESVKVDKESQNMLFDQFDYLINRTGIPWGTVHINPNDYKNIHYMESRFLKLDLSDESKEKLTRIKKYITKHENKKKRT